MCMHIMSLSFAKVLTNMNITVAYFSRSRNANANKPRHEVQQVKPIYKLATGAKAVSVYCRVSWCLDSTVRRYTAFMDPKSLASKITRAGADKVLEKNPKNIDDAAVNTVIKQGANALESGASKSTVDPAVGAAAEVRSRAGQTAEPIFSH